MPPSSSSPGSSARVIRSYEDDQRYRAIRAERHSARIGYKCAICLLSLTACGTIAWLALYMRAQIFNFREISANQIDHTGSIEDAEFGYFGPQAENVWRAFLIAQLALAFLASLYIPIGVLFEHYYPIALYGAFMFTLAVLSIGNQYMAVPYYLASGVFFATGLATHIGAHYLRLDIVDEIVFWNDQKCFATATADGDANYHDHDSTELSTSFELRLAPRLKS